MARYAHNDTLSIDAWFNIVQYWYELTKSPHLLYMARVMLVENAAKEGKVCVLETYIHFM